VADWEPLRVPHLPCRHRVRCGHPREVDHSFSLLGTLRNLCVATANKEFSARHISVPLHHIIAVYLRLALGAERNGSRSYCFGWWRGRMVLAGKAFTTSWARTALTSASSRNRRRTLKKIWPPLSASLPNKRDRASGSLTAMGAVTTEAGTDPFVAGLVYIAAHMPDARESEADDGKREVAAAHAR
jgi:hypothetical protein